MLITLSKDLMLPLVEHYSQLWSPSYGVSATNVHHSNQRTQHHGLLAETTTSRHVLTGEKKGKVYGNIRVENYQRNGNKSEKR